MWGGRRTKVDALVVAPVEVKPEHIYVIVSGPFDIADRNLRNGLGKVREHAVQLTALWTPDTVSSQLQ